MGELLWIFVSAAIVNNFTLILFLGLCSFVGVTQSMETSLRLGAANLFVMVMTSIAVWLLNTYVLAAAPFLRIIAFIVVIASLVQMVEMLVKKTAPGLYRALGIYLPLITTNCAILGFAIFQTNRNYNFLEGIFYSLGAGVGLALAYALMATIRIRLELSDVPNLAKGMGIVFIIAGCLSLAFMGFAGLFSAG